MPATSTAATRAIVLIIFIITSSGKLLRVQLSNGPHFDAADAGGRNLRGGLDRLVPIVRVDQIELCDAFFRFGERPTRDRHLAVPHADRFGGPNRLKRPGRVEFPALPERRAAG